MPTPPTPGTPAPGTPAPLGEEPEEAVTPAGFRRRSVLTALAAAGFGAAGIAAAPRSHAAPSSGKPRAAQAADPDFGPNVSLFGPDTPAADIQAKVDSVFAAQETNQFGNGASRLPLQAGHVRTSTRTSASTPRSPAWA